MKIGEIIKNYRIENNLSMDELANRCGVSKGYISILEKDKNPISNKPLIPTIASLEKLSKGMNMSLDNLLLMMKDEKVSWDDDNETILKKASVEYMTIPLYSPICCGNGGFNEDNIIDYIAVPLQGSNPHKEYYCQYAKGDSMEGAGIYNEDLLVFEKTSQISEGNIGCFCIDENEATCKKLKIQNNMFILMPCNDKYDPIFVDSENFRCVGKLVMSVRRFK